MADTHELRREFEGDDFHVFGKRYQDLLILSGSNDRLGFKGHLSAKLVYPNGTIITRVLGRNIVVNSGLDNIVRTLCAQYPSSSSYQIDTFAIGNASVTEDPGLTALGNQIYSAPPSVTFSPTGKLQLDLLLAAGPGGWPGSGSQTINEAGLLASSASPSLVTYKKFTDLTLDGSFSATLQWEIQATYVGS